MIRTRLPSVLAASVMGLFFVAACTGGDGEGTPFPTATVPSATSSTSDTPEATRVPSTTTPTAVGTSDGTVAATPDPTQAPTATAAPSTATPPPPSATPTPVPTSAAPQPVGFVEALGGRVFNRPIELGPYPDGRVHVADQGGVVFILDPDGGNEDILLDIRSQVSRDGNEEGLLSVAFDPGFANNRHLWAYYSRSNPRRSVLSRFTVGQFEADLGSELVVLEVDQPFSNHNGGAVRFGFDGMLYLGLGDGGSGGDPLGSGQDRSTLLGSVIRIDVRNASQGALYAVPSDNPFVDEAGVHREIWAYGIRNPWRMSFDPSSGALWLGDVGQGAIEEISVIQRGANYGWNITEGNLCYQSQNCLIDGLTFPVAVYGHSGGRCSVSGGVIYRGSEVPEVASNYLYGDFCSGEVWAMPVDGSSAPVIVASGLGNIASFGVDAAGEVYVLRFGESIVRLVSP